jgi:hypothetical protein
MAVSIVQGGDRGPCTGNNKSIKKKKKEYSLIGKIGSFKLQILSSSLSALDLPEFSALRIRLTRFLNLIGKVCF